MNNKRTILWEYWQNPYGGRGPEFVDEKDANVPDSAWEEKEVKEFQVRPVIPTSMGLLPISPFKNFTDVFEFWIGNANFYITEEVKDTIEFTSGVEILEVFSPYRFRICIGKAFKGADVKYEIQRVLNALPERQEENNPNEMPLDNKTETKVLSLKSTLDKNFDYWAIYVMPNGEIDVSGSNTKEGHKMQLELYNEALSIAGGVIYKHE